MTRQQAISFFNDEWEFTLIRFPELKNDEVAKRTAFTQYIDSLNKDGQLSNKQVNSWANPF